MVISSCTASYRRSREEHTCRFDLSNVALDMDKMIDSLLMDIR